MTVEAPSQAAEADWRAVVELMPQAAVIGQAVRDEAGRVTDWRYLAVNAAWERLLSRSRRDVLGRTVREILATVDERWIDPVSGVLDQGAPWTFTMDFGRSGRWFEGSAFAVSADRFGIVFVEATQRLQAEARREALLKLSDALRDLSDPNEIAFASAEILGGALAVSRVGYGLVDTLAETITIDRDWSAPGVRSLAGQLNFRDYGSYIEDLARGDTVVFADAELDPRTAASAAALERISARAAVNMPLRDHGGLVALVYLNNAEPRPWSSEDLGFIREVAERTHAVMERRRVEARLRELAQSLERKVAERTEELMVAEEHIRQSQKMEAVGQLTGGVAHDFNNLLTIIRSSVDFLKREDLAPARRARYVSAISDTVDRASRLTGQLLAFARRQALKPEVFEVGRRVETVVEMIRPVMGARITIHIEPSQPLFTEADVSQFETALINLCVNARDAMQGEGELTLRVEERVGTPSVRGHASAAGPFVAVSVADCGSGIDPSRIANIFEPFYTTKEVGRGTGLGLSQVFGFAKQSGGEIDVQSAPGRGSTFTLFLPRTEPVRAERAAGGDGAIVGRPERPLRVLVVEDNETVGRFATEMLADLGYGSVWAEDAAQALSALEDPEHRFDIVFTDVVMPGMNGLDLARTVRQIHPGLPVVLTSGYSTVLAEEGRHGFELLKKPYSVEALSQVLRAVVEAFAPKSLRSGAGAPRPAPQAAARTPQGEAK
jgi:signal transduction histidine kinase/ActR/RegA family two-component response regulator